MTSNYFREYIYRRIYSRKFLTLFNYMSRYKFKCIRILFDSSHITNKRTKKAIMIIIRHLILHVYWLISHSLNYIKILLEPNLLPKRILLPDNKMRLKSGIDGMYSIHAFCNHIFLLDFKPFSNRTEPDPNTQKYRIEP